MEEYTRYFNNKQEIKEQIEGLTENDFCNYSYLENGICYRIKSNDGIVVNCIILNV